MAKKNVKIKRYEKSLSSDKKFKKGMKNITLSIIISVAFFCFGVLIAKPGIDLATKLWYESKSAGESKSDVSSSAASSSASSKPSESNSSSDKDKVTSKPVVAGKNLEKSNVTVDLNTFITAESTKKEAERIKALGIENAIIPLKDETGLIYYKTTGEVATLASAPQNVIDAAAAVKIFKEVGVNPVAEIFAFKDATAPYLDREMAVKYSGGGDFNWLDNNKELGGKTWLNPASAKAQGYISGIIDELKGFGFETVLIQGFQFPDINVSSSASFGTMTGSVTDVLKGIAAEFDKKENVELWYQFPAAPIQIGGEMWAYGGAPSALGLKNVIIEQPLEEEIENAGTNSNAG